MNNLFNMTSDEEQKLLSKYQESFEKLYLDLTNNFSIQEQQKVIEDMVKLLTVTEDNYKELSSEKWFQRAFYTIKGKNKKLNEINKINLMEIQKKSALFLMNYANNSQVLSVAVNRSLDKLDNLDQQNAKLKRYIIEWTRRNNARNEEIERRLERLEKKNGIFKHNIFEQTYNKFVDLIGNKKENNSKDRVNYNKEIKNYDNIGLKIDVKKNIEKFLMIVIEEDAYESIMFIAKNIEKYQEFYDILEKNEQGEINMTDDEIIKLLEEIVYYQPINKEILRSNVVSCVNLIIDNLQSFNEEFVTEYIPESLSRLIIDIPYSDKLRISENCIKQLAEINIYIDTFLKKREHLIEIFPNVKKLANRSDLSYFIEGAIPVWGVFAALDGIFFDGAGRDRVAKSFGIKTGNAYFNEFWQGLFEMIELYNNIFCEASKLVYLIVKNECQSYLKSWMYNYDVILDEFIKYNVDLKEVNKECLDTIKEYQK